MTAAARLALLALALLAAAAGPALADALPTRFTLRTGQVVEGAIVDRLPAGYLLRFADGSTRVLPYEDIANIDAPAPAAPPPAYPAAPPPPPPQYYAAPPPYYAAPPAPPRKQVHRGVRIEAEAGIGYTAVDRREWAGANPRDWEQMLTTGALRLLFPALGPVRFGLEGGYRHFWWYSVPYSNYTISHDVEAKHFALLTRFGNRFVSLDLAATVDFFGDFTDTGAETALHFHIPLGSVVELMLGPRVGVVFDTDTNLIPIAFNTGLGFKL